jgi:peptidylprolyl isomerase
VVDRWGGYLFRVHSGSVKSLLAVGLSSALLLLGACGEEGPSSDASASPSASPTASSATPTPTPSPVAVSDNFDKVKVTGSYGETPKVTVQKPWAIDKTRTKVLEPSNGAVVKDGQTVEVNYYGVNGRTGKQFDESFSSKQSVAFSLDQVVPGFRKGLIGQRQGSRVLIGMPGSDGYDASGGSPDAGIEVGDTLVFVVDLVGVQLSGPEGAPVTPKAGLPRVTDAKGVPTITIPASDPPAKLQVQPLIKGRGKKVRDGDMLTFDYRWVTWQGNRLLEESYSGKPAKAALDSLLPGMVKGLTGQTVGSRVLLVIPPSDGYPNGNDKPKVERTDTLVMVVDILFTQSQ